ncbi:formylglycine-generating enzyme family protein [uncultured Hymenobacter sp.]|uniref:formylglycine-generating enzyme family protein n=1 Tax=uncultured Hymenobacter sp. TaxID=170016 RepID=UPI0035CA300E
MRKWHLIIALGLLLASCQPEAPKQFVYSPTITVFETEPTQKPVLASRPPATLPAGMVYVPGGYTQIGSEEGLDQEKPTVWVSVKPFLMDQHEVTVGQFRAFVQATKYRTQAESFGNAGVFNDSTKEWGLVPGANWQYPYGPSASPAAADQPVAQVSWADAQAYAQWAGKRLPDEIEWEHAARNGTNSRALYPTGNSLQVNGKFVANTWNGRFPDDDQATDGFHRAAPVGSFGTSPLGLADMSGNVWEWCANSSMSYAELMNPVAAASQTERAQRGGSFLCEPGWCHGYRVSGRASSTPETALMHVGFRCVQDLP